MSPNPDHEMSIQEAMQTVEVRDAAGNLIDPSKMEVDPDWIEHMEDDSNGG